MLNVMNVALAFLRVTAKDANQNIYKMKNTVKKTKKPTFVVDLTNAQTYEDVKIAFICAKAANGKITDTEVTNLINFGANMVLDYVAAIEDERSRIAKGILKIVNKAFNEKKDPWYKRAWRWITKPFRKNK